MMMLAVGSTSQPAAASQPPASIVNVDDDGEDEDIAQQQVLDCLVDEFLQIVGSVDRQTACQYLTSNRMDLQAALGVYFDDEAS